MTEEAPVKRTKPVRFVDLLIDMKTREKEEAAALLVAEHPEEARLLHGILGRACEAEARVS